MSQQKSLLAELRILSIYWPRLMEGVVQDVRQRYIGSVLGLTWVVLFPFLQLSIYAVLYSFVFRVKPAGLDQFGYIVMVFSGLVPLMTFSEALNMSINSLHANKNLLLNTVFPAELIPLRAALAAQTPGLVGLIITLIAGVALGRTGWQAIFLIPVFWVLLLMFAAGLGWVLSLFSLVARDIQQGISLIIMVLFFLSPFAYTPEMVPVMLKPLLYLNPLSYYVIAFQQIICYGIWPQSFIAGGAAIIGIGSFFGGYILFQRIKFIFFDYA